MMINDQEFVGMNKEGAIVLLRDLGTQYRIIFDDNGVFDGPVADIGLFRFDTINFPDRINLMIEKGIIVEACRG